jgi:hypothetical protein
LEGKAGDIVEFLEEENSQLGDEDIDPGTIEKYGIFKKFHNSWVAHLSLG